MKLFAIHIDYTTDDGLGNHFDWCYVVRPYMSHNLAEGIILQDMTEGQEELKKENINVIDVWFSTLDEVDGYTIGLKEA